MTTKNINEQAREIAQKLVNLEITRKTTAEEIKDLKDELHQLMLEYPEVDKSFDLNEGMVFLQITQKLSVPDGLKDAVEPTSKQPEKLSQELLTAYLKSDLKLNKAGTKALKEGDVDLASIIVVEDVEKISIKLA